MAYLAMYLRLSVEDDGESEESNSISNQRKMIAEYIRHDSELCRYDVMEFCDDGCSGTTMHRPGMQKLLKAVKSRKIKCIIVKDMSRFSRDYIEMGTYLNRIFPFLGIRFISINDCYDSVDHHGNTIEIDTAFKTILYDLFCRDVSVKVKASFENKCANGEYVFGQVPFGYEKSREVKNAVVVNEKEAEIVRYIFSLALQGKSSTQIARQLYAEGVPAIMKIRRPNRGFGEGKVYSWSENSVRRVLNNRFYLGEMAYGKSVRKSVGSKSSIAVPKENWKVIPNHHEALISEEIFEQVSSFRTGVSTKRNCEKHPLTGKLYCGGCGYSMNYKPMRGKNRYSRFECRKHALLKIPECCTYMRADLLEETVLCMLNKELMFCGNTMRHIELLQSLQRAGIVALKNKQKEYQAEIEKKMAKKVSLYEKYALGEINREEYQKRAGRLTENISLLSVKSDEITSKSACFEGEKENTQENMHGKFQKNEHENVHGKFQENEQENMQENLQESANEKMQKNFGKNMRENPQKNVQHAIKQLHIDELTTDVVEIFIRKIYVYKDKRIEIEWNFAL